MKRRQDWRARPRVLALPLAAAFLLLAPVAHADSCPRFVSGSQGLPTRGEWRTHPALGDVDGDGRLDLAGNPRKESRPGVWLNEGAKDWKLSVRGIALPTVTCGVGVAFADVNEDGHLDLGVADHCSGLYLFLGDGKGDWKVGIPPLRGLERGFEALAFGDLDGDKHLDLVAVSSLSGGFAVALGDGKGSFKRHSSGLPTKGFGSVVKLADVDGNGTLDLVAAFTSEYLRKDERKLHLLFSNDGHASFTSLATGLPDQGEIQGAAVGDSNGDGFKDLVFSSFTRNDYLPLSVLLGDGGKTWKPANAGLPPISEDVYDYYAVQLVDLDGDGRDDLVASSHRDAGLHVWMSKAAGGWQACPTTGLPGGRTELRGWGIGVGDVNGDKRPDLAYGLGRDARGGLEVWLQAPVGSSPAGAVKSDSNP